MCECGCTANDERYTFPAPDNNIYLLTLSGGCESCNGPSGITIELVKRGTFMYKYINEHNDLYIDGPLIFKKWPDSMGVAIVTGYLKHEFVEGLSNHLIGLKDQDGDEVDDIRAEIILEEMYTDAVYKPSIVE